MALALGLTWMKFPDVSVTRIRSCEVLEDAAPLLDLLMERLPCPPAFGDIARDLGGADDLAGERPDRRDAQQHVDVPAVLVHALGGVVLDSLAGSNLLQDPADLRVPLRRKR